MLAFKDSVTGRFVVFAPEYEVYAVSFEEDSSFWSDKLPSLSELAIWFEPITDPDEVRRLARSAARRLGLGMFRLRRVR